MKKPSEILTYPQFVEGMKDPGFQARMHYAMGILMEFIEKDPSYLIGDDKRITEYWLQYHNDPLTIKPKLFITERTSFLGNPI